MLINSAVISCEQVEINTNNGNKRVNNEHNEKEQSLCNTNQCELPCVTQAYLMFPMAVLLHFFVELLL